jgi:hypothetical protein
LRARTDFISPARIDVTIYYSPGLLLTLRHDCILLESVLSKPLIIKHNSAKNVPPMGQADTANSTIVSARLLNY